MPTYQYACTACGNQLEAVQSFSDAPLTECPACQGRLRKLFNSVGIVFKGSGFYRTDSRTAGKESLPGTTKPATKTESSGGSDSSSSGSSTSGGSATGSSTGSSSGSGGSGSGGSTTKAASSSASA
ncbi:FmdB family zinc ribbon protein [Micromonospora echinofusca]|uniref:FmdB family transcriptional regulator n=1 Tax=Micromonospora echinofusca TaxID=47858 RepID=A0ABS3VX99_MICEH|nr:FmdB family zinc ribbon protein [Micromonospora echinofusca]MBO4209159.1 FmdB family transcriptional regulator [Micromonospora echinofusca]